MDTDGTFEKNPIAYIDNMLGYYMPSLDVSALDESSWALTFKQLLDLRKKENSTKEK